MPLEYDPYSLNAVVSRIMERFDRQDAKDQEYREAVRHELAAIRTAVEHTNGRVTELEQDRAKVRGAVFATAGIVSALWAVWTWVTNLAKK